MFFPVLPLASGAILRQKNLDSIVCQTFGNDFLVLMTGVNRIPVRLSAFPVGWVRLNHANTPPSCDIQEVHFLNRPLDRRREERLASGNHASNKTH
jgi:hypothetical protein